tara:strand:+ start:474 stop:1448 length:975 start_codon:yes stop_codon:yes gene_type:complete
MWNIYSGNEIDWNEFIKKRSGADFRQTFFWGNYLEEIGWNVRRIELAKNKKRVALIQYSFKKLWPLCAVYINGLDHVDIKYIPEIMEKINRENKLFLTYFRLDSHDIHNEETINWLHEQGFSKTIYSLRNNTHTVFNLEQTKDEILKNAKQKWRYNYKRAKMKKIYLETIQKIDPHKIYKLSSELSNFKKIRNLYSLPELIAYKKYLSKNIFIVEARDSDLKIVGYYICIIFNNKAYQIFNAVNKKGNELMAGYSVLIYLYDSLKKINIKEVYLGEMNKVRYPGNYQFKSGFNQKTIQVIGEFEISKINIIKKIFNFYLYLINA